MRWEHLAAAAAGAVSGVPAALALGPQNVSLVQPAGHQVDRPRLKEAVRKA